MTHTVIKITPQRGERRWTRNVRQVIQDHPATSDGPGPWCSVHVASAEECFRVADALRRKFYDRVYLDMACEFGVDFEDPSHSNVMVRHLGEHAERVGRRHEFRQVKS